MSSPFRLCRAPVGGIRVGRGRGEWEGGISPPVAGETRKEKRSQNSVSGINPLIAFNLVRMALCCLGGRPKVHPPGSPSSIRSSVGVGVGGGSKHLLLHLLVHVSYSWRRSTTSPWELSLSANASVCRMCRSDSSESCFTGLLFPYLYTHFLFLSPTADTTELTKKNKQTNSKVRSAETL